MVDFGGNSHQALTGAHGGDGRHHRLGRGGLVVRYSHLAIPLGSLPASPARPSPIQGGLDAINGAEWMKVVYGILLSTLLGFGLGWINYKVIAVCAAMWIA